MMDFAGVPELLEELYFDGKARFLDLLKIERKISSQNCLCAEIVETLAQCQNAEKKKSLIQLEESCVERLELLKQEYLSVKKEYNFTADCFGMAFLMIFFGLERK